MPSVDDVQEALTNVIDPELGLDFVELGLVYEVEVEDEDVYVTFTLTSPGCPIGPQVTEQMQEFVSELPDVERVFPKMVFSPYSQEYFDDPYGIYRQMDRAADAARELSVFQELKKQQEGAAVPEDMEWNVYAEIYDAPPEALPLAEQLDSVNKQP